ncbi:MAG: cytochrome c peroxidase [Deltaproteobacteria bacterium]|nr:cytochrome c peroxidase [Deltaproteobacteria bacterium]
MLQLRLVDAFLVSVTKTCPKVVLAFALFAGVCSGAHAELFEPLVAPKGLDTEKVALGRRLFFETKLSKDETLSCASCHDLATGGHDPRPFSVGVGGRVGELNSPTVFNAANNFKQFWDGRAADLVEQVDGPVTNPAEMAAEWPVVIERLSRDATYATAFQKKYKDGVTPSNVRDAIATFEKSLITLDSKFDRYLLGNKKALNAQELRGFEAFQKRSCDKCHNGSNLGGVSFERFGVVGKPSFLKGAGSTQRRDMGRFNVTKSKADLHRFKVPTLRNVELTGPYFHNASAATLAEAVKVMAEVQLGIILEPNEVDDIVAFLRTLTGKPPASIASLANPQKRKL